MRRSSQSTVRSQYFSRELTALLRFVLGDFGLCCKETSPCFVIAAVRSCSVLGKSLNLSPLSFAHRGLQFGSRDPGVTRRSRLGAGLRALPAHTDAQQRWCRSTSDARRLMHAEAAPQNITELTLLGASVFLFPISCLCCSRWIYCSVISKTQSNCQHISTVFRVSLSL